MGDYSLQFCNLCNMVSYMYAGGQLELGNSKNYHRIFKEHALI